MFSEVVETEFAVVIALDVGPVVVVFVADKELKVVCADNCFCTVVSGTLVLLLLLLLLLVDDVVILLLFIWHLLLIFQIDNIIRALFEFHRCDLCWKILININKRKRDND